MVNTEEHQERRKKWNTINKKHLPLKVFYFTLSSAAGVLLPFVPLYMKEVGLTSAQTGITYGVMPFLAFFVRPCFGIIADRLKRHYIVLALCCTMSALFYLTLFLIPHTIIIKSNVKTEVLCRTEGSFITHCFNELKDQTCPLTFSKYMNLADMKNNTGNISSPNNSAASPNDLRKKNLDLLCKLVCHTNGEQLKETQICLSNNHEVKCLESPVIDQTEYSLLLNGFSDVGGEERDLQLDENLKCQTLKFNSIVYKNQSFSQMFCNVNLPLECNLQCFSNQENSCSSKEITKRSLWMFGLFYLLGYIFYTPIGSIGDTITYHNLGKDSKLYGRQRLWGTISYALFAFSATFITELINTYSSSINFSISFYGYSALLLLTAICAWRMPRPEGISSERNFQQLCKLFKNGEVVLFLAVLFYFGFLKGTRDTFLFWFLSELAGYRPIIPGLCTLVSSIVEVTVYQFGGILIERIGHIYCLCIVFVAYLLRYLSYSFLTNAWYVLPVELLHGLTYTLMLFNASSYGRTIAPPGMLATMQGLISGLYSGVGKGIGSILTGLIYSYFGFVKTFQLYSYLTAGFLILFLIVNRLCLKSPRFLKKDKSAKDEAPYALSTKPEIYVLEIGDKYQNNTKKDIDGFNNEETIITRF